MIPTWTQQMAGQGSIPALNLNFLDPANVLDSRVTFTRASSGTYVDSSGVLQTASTNIPRFDYSPTSVGTPLGLLIEEARTNSIRNNTFTGGSAPTTDPTNMGFAGGTTAGLTKTYSFGTVNGMEYMDIRLNGTTSSTGCTFNFETAAGITASAGQVWTESIYLAIVGGTMTNVGSVQVSNNVLGGTGSTNTTAALTSTLTRFSNSTPALGVGTTNVRPALLFNLTNGAAVDITVRIALPQIELGVFSTSVIKTTGSTATRAGDVVSMTGTNFSSWYNQSQGTFVADFDFNGFISTSGVNQAIVAATDNTSNNRIFTFWNSGLPLFDSRIVAATVAYNPGAPLGTPVVGVAQKVALTYAIGSNQGQIARNGSLGTLASSPVALPVVTQLSIGINETLSGQQLNGHMRRLQFYPIRQPNAQLQVLTT